MREITAAEEIAVVLEPDEDMVAWRQQRGVGEAQPELMQQRVALEQREIERDGRDEQVGQRAAALWPVRIRPAGACGHASSRGLYVPLRRIGLAAQPAQCLSLRIG